MDEVLEPARELAAAIDRAIPPWVARCVDRCYRASLGRPLPADVAAAARAAGDAAGADIGPRVRALLEADIDAQWTTPLALIRQAVPYPTQVLSAAAVPPVARDRFAQEQFPDDVYNLSPAAYSDLDPSLTGPALAWGAAKAWEHRRRHSRARALLVYAPDLMDRSKLVAAAPSATIVARPEELVARAGDTVILDLSRPGAPEAVPPLVAAGARVIGFASHVDRERIEAARAEGCEVLPRSAFFSRLAELLA